MDKTIIDLLNKRRSYKVIIKGDKEEEMTIRNVRGIHINEHHEIMQEIVDADIMAVSVGRDGLGSILPLIAKALSKRYERYPLHPLDIILAENMRNAAVFSENILKEHLGNDFPVKKYIGLVETSIGKMVPIMTAEDLEMDPLQIFAEEYNTLILDRKGFRNPVPDIPWLAPKDNMQAWVDRKSLIHNLGHASAAYIGFIRHPEAVFLYEILEDAEIFNLVQSTMVQSASILQSMYQGEFTEQELLDHINDLLHRFMNKALKDTVFRIGCDLGRKLSKDDRLASAVQEAICFNMKYDKILYALVCGFYFRAKDENGEFHPNDRKFYNNFVSESDYLLKTYCGFDPLENQDIFVQAKKYCSDINNQFNPEIIIT